MQEGQKACAPFRSNVLTDKSVADPGLPRGGHPSDFLHFHAVFRKIGRIIVWRPWIRHWNTLIVKKRGLINLTLVQHRVRYAVYALERFSVAHTPHIDNIYSGGSKGGREGCAPPTGVQILSISCSFWEYLAKSYVGAPPGSWRRGSRPKLYNVDPPLYS